MWPGIAYQGAERIWRQLAGHGKVLSNVSMCNLCFTIAWGTETPAYADPTQLRVCRTNMAPQRFLIKICSESSGFHGSGVIRTQSSVPLARFKSMAQTKAVSNARHVNSMGTGFVFCLSSYSIPYAANKIRLIPVVLREVDTKNERLITKTHSLHLLLLQKSHRYNLPVHLPWLHYPALLLPH